MKQNKCSYIKKLNMYVYVMITTQISLGYH